ncbi:glycoside hydrolase family 16 protein [Pedobacter glucosidilyticus]|uniref:glycoside hydrolase family 16 protein n=1 Tax=Pedobacter glucosidilyticus TaxID=1122941 RepID=UPI0004178A3A|nr:glycoside hydrolase family 16 protein [Pedobacter glucosidilyticus]
MKLKAYSLVAAAAISLLNACQKDVLTPSEKKVVGSNKNLAAQMGTSTSDDFFIGFKPDPSYQMMFTDRFFNNNIAQNHNWWEPRTDFTRIFASDTGDFTGYNRAANNEVVNGMLNIKFNKDADGKYYGGGIISKKMFGYGYYEAKVKIYTGTYGLHQSFWSLAPAVEIDGFEIDSKLISLAPLQPGRHRWFPDQITYKPTSAEKANFYYHPNTKLNEPVPNDDGIWTDADGFWITAGYEWLPNVVNYYVNGQLRASYPLIDSFGNDVNVYQPSSIYLTALPFDIYPAQPMVEPQEGAKMQVEYVAYYSRPLNNVNLLGNNSFNYVESKFITTGKNEAPTGWTEYASALNTPTYNYSVPYYQRTNSYAIQDGTNWILEHRNDTSDYKAITLQQLNFIANGTYKLSADIKCSAHQITNGLQIVILGKDKTTVIKSRAILNPQANWINVIVDDIPVTENEVTVMLFSNAKAGEYFQADNISFTRKF